MTGRSLFATFLIWAMGSLSVGVAQSPAQPPLGISVLDCQLAQPGATPGDPFQPFAVSEALRGKKALVLIFVEPHCPVCANYLSSLEKLMVPFKDEGVAWALVDASYQPSQKQVIANRPASLKIPYLFDENNQWAEKLKVDRVPCAIVADGGGKVRYRGRIDDQFAPGIARSKATQRDLAEAIQAVVTGKEVARPWTDTAGCLRTVAKTEKKSVPVAEMTWAGGVAKTIQTRCQGCHRPGEAGPFPLMTYQDTVAWADMIREVVEKKVMPPWHADSPPGHFVNDRRLTDLERNNLITWIDAGCPEGDMSRAPANPTYETGWRGGKPDKVFTMSREVSVPASYLFGAVGMPYQYVLSDETVDEDRWVKTIEVRPDQRAQIHHIIVFIIPEGKSFQETLRGGGDGFGGAMLGAYVPGDFPINYPEGMGKKLPKGAKLLFEMHYTPNGKAVVDRSSVGVTFTKEKPKHEVRTRSIANPRFRIPPGDPNHEVKSASRFDKPAVILSYSPHMHLRGKDFAFHLVNADKTRTQLLSVPRYDFNWQESYHLAKPLRVEKGQTIECIAHFDNSPGNPANPDPKKEVRWGEMTWDEMMIGFIDYYYES